MPLFDGTGPFGQGPFTGRGYGGCRIGDFESEVNAVYRPRFEMTVTREGAVEVGQEWLDAGVAYMVDHGWSQRDIDNAVANLNHIVNQRVQDFEEIGRPRTEAERWGQVLEKTEATRKPPVAGIVVLGLGAVAFVAGLYFVVTRLSGPPPFRMGQVVYPVIPE